jgi:uncharacterized protein (TIGR02996 family)
MASHLQALLEDVKLNPHDDTPRLVLADWLQENGASEAERARGECIALQCRLATTPEGDSPRRRGWWQRQDELRQAFVSTWLGPWWEVMQQQNRNPSTWSFERGMLWLHLQGGQKVGDSWWALVDVPEAWTWVEGVRVSNLSFEEREFFLQSSCLGRLASLDLSGNNLDTQGGRSLAGCSRLARLSALHLRFTRLGEGGGQALARSRYLEHLTHLHLGGNFLGDRGVQALAESAHLANLRHLELWSNRVSVVGALALAHSPFLEHLTHLDLSNNPLGESGREALRKRFGSVVVF